MFMIFDKSLPANLPADEVQATPTAPDFADVPLPNPNSIFLGALFFLAMLTVCFVARQIIMPTVLAFILKLVLQPVMRVLTRWHVPRLIAASLILVLLFGSFFALGSALSDPASNWGRQFADSMPKLRERLGFILEPVVVIQGILHNADGMANTVGVKPVTVAIEGSRLSDRLMIGTQDFVMGIGQTVLVLFFLLIAGDTFLRRLVEILPRFQDKRHAVQISQQIESDISAYLATITMMNVAVGFATGMVMALCHVRDPVLWGAMAMLLNYVPIMGPITGIAIFGMVGLLSNNEGLVPALLPAGLYLLIHLSESMIITPHFLSKRFTLNPVMVMLGLIFWYWMWGMAGTILATPMLAITKIICDNIPSLKPVGHFFEGETRSEPANTA